MASTNLAVLTNSAPISASLAPACVRGELAKRMMIILRAPGCAYDLRPEGGCTYCNFRALTTQGLSVSSTDLIKQFNSLLKQHNCARERIFEIDIYNSGSFLNDGEVPAEAREAILKRCAREQSVRLVLIESRPEYITASRISDLNRASARPEPFALEVAIGLETADDVIREKGLRKGITRKGFERAVRILGETGTDLLTYVMLKPLPMSDDDALRSVIRTAEYVHDVATSKGVRARIALELTFVVPNTRLAEDYEEGKYQPPSLWLALEAVKCIAPLGELSVGLWDEGLSPLAKSTSCALCQHRIVPALYEFNMTQDVGALDVPTCLCANTYKFEEHHSTYVNFV